MPPLIDADGRLLGRFNLLDVLAVAFLVLIGGLVGSATGIFTRARPRPVPSLSSLAPSDGTLPSNAAGVSDRAVPSVGGGVAPNLQGNLVPATLEANALLFDLTPEEASQLAVGDAQRDADGRVSRELVSIYRVDARRKATNVELEHPVWVVEPRERQANVRIRFYGYRANDMFFIEGGQRLRAASQLPFQTAKYSATFQLGELDRPASWQLPPVKMEMSALLIELTPEEAKRVAPGDRHVNATGETVAEIVSVGTPTVRQVVLNLGSRVTVSDPREWQVPVVLRLYGYRTGTLFMTREDERVAFGPEVRYRFVTDRYEAGFYILEPSQAKSDS